jgi:hypothetical protein
MSRTKVGQASASALFFAAILLFSLSLGVFTKSSSTNSALRPAVKQGQILTAEGTVPPPIKKPSTVS